MSKETVNLVLRLSKPLHAKVKAKAKKDFQSMNQYINKILEKEQKRTEKSIG